jgi:hypothetical protein
MTEGRKVQRLFRVTPPLGARGPAYVGEYYTPTLISVWPCGTPFGNTQEGPDRLRSAPITDPLSRSTTGIEPHPAHECVLLLQDLLQSCSRGGGEDSGGHVFSTAERLQRSAPSPLCTYREGFN